MYNFLSKNGQMLAFGGGVIITAIFLFFVFGGIESFTALAEGERNTSDIFNFGLYAVIALSLIGLLSAFGFGLLQVFSDPKGAIKGIGGIALIVALFFIGQAMAGVDTEAIIETRREFSVTDGQSAIISGSIYGALLLAILTGISFVGSEVRNLFK